MSLCTKFSFDISRLKKATVILFLKAAFTQIFRAREVFPIDGLPAIMINSPGWKPEVSSSRV